MKIVKGRDLSAGIRAKVFFPETRDLGLIEKNKHMMPALGKECFQLFFALINWLT